MKDTLKAIFYSISAIAFIIFIAVFYLSEENKRHTYKIRTQYLEKVNNYLSELPFLINDTENIINFKDDLNESKKNIIKRKFWELIENK
tara:strand:+ start:291 stop:557 length:267 start_codon:yes stop_codon:yes gene_type:complete